jgi:hypothetical protein
VFVEDDQPCRLDYRIELNTAWRTMSVRVTGLLGVRTILVDIAVGGRREWVMNGRACPDVYGCDDIDLSFSPATNLLPIRRLGLGTGQQAPARAAWLRFPACVLEPLDQNYERVAHSAYRYESAGGFTAMLTVNAVGFVTCYPGWWKEESSDPSAWHNRNR